MHLAFLLALLCCGSFILETQALLVRNSLGTKWIEFYHSTAEYGPKVPNYNASGYFAFPLGDDIYLCDDVKPPQDEYKDRIVLTLQGQCSFSDKTLIAQKYGAVALVVANAESDQLFVMITKDKTHNFTIPSIFVGRSAYEYIKQRVKNYKSSETTMQHTKQEETNSNSTYRDLSSTPSMEDSNSTVTDSIVVVHESPSISQSFGVDLANVNDVEVLGRVDITGAVNTNIQWLNWMEKVGMLMALMVVGVVFVRGVGVLCKYCIGKCKQSQRMEISQQMPTMIGYDVDNPPYVKLEDVKMSKAQMNNIMSKESGSDENEDGDIHVEIDSLGTEGVDDSISSRSDNSDGNENEDRSNRESESGTYQSTWQFGTPVIMNGTCVVCLDDFDKSSKIKILPCHHGFHPGCIDPWLQKSELCPICNQSVYDNLDDPIYTSLAGARFSKRRKRCCVCCK